MAKGLTAAELRVSDEDELKTRLSEAKEELFNLRFQGATGQLESHGRLRAVRREIARIYTVMRERELGIVTEFEEVPEYVETPGDQVAPAAETAAGTEAPAATAEAGATAEPEAGELSEQEADESE